MSEVDELREQVRALSAELAGKGSYQRGVQGLRCDARQVASSEGPR
jgi:hypothetical protein